MGSVKDSEGTQMKQFKFTLGIMILTASLSLWAWPG